MATRDGDDLTIEIGARNADGTVAPPYFRRRFRDCETDEVRIYLREGNDRVVVKGGRVPFRLRVIATGEGVLDDREGGGTKLYDSNGKFTVLEGRGTCVDRRPYTPPKSIAPRYLEADYIPARDWGSDWYPFPILGYEPDVGFFLGGGLLWKTYAFRKHPWSTKHLITAGWAFEASLTALRRRSSTCVRGFIFRGGERGDRRPRQCFSELENARPIQLVCEPLRPAPFPGSQVVSRASQSKPLANARDRCETGRPQSIGLRGRAIVILSRAHRSPPPVRLSHAQLLRSEFVERLMSRLLATLVLVFALVGFPATASFAQRSGGHGRGGGFHGGGGASRGGTGLRGGSGGFHRGGGGLRGGGPRGGTVRGSGGPQAGRARHPHIRGPHGGGDSRGGWQGRSGGHGHDRHKHGGHGHHGHGHGHGHGSHWRGSVFVGGPWWYDSWWGWPYPYVYRYPYYGLYGYPYAYYPPPYDPGAYLYPEGSSEYIQKEPQTGEYPAGYWYYCASSKGYYPTVQHCPEDWIQVPPAPP